MEERQAKSQTIATRKYEKKVGIIAKSYKLRKSLVDEFKKACDSKGEAQAAVISRFMEEYISETNK